GRRPPALATLPQTGRPGDDGVDAAPLVLGHRILPTPRAARLRCARCERAWTQRGTGPRTYAASWACRNHIRVQRQCNLTMTGIRRQPRCCLPNLRRTSLRIVARIAGVPTHP